MPNAAEVAAGGTADRDSSQMPLEVLAPQRMAALADDFAACRELFVALGDESRQLIFMELLRHWGGMRVGEVTERINLSRPAVSHHLKILREAGLVDMYEVGTKNFYFVNPDLERWGRLTRLTNEAESLVREVARRHASGEDCGKRTE